MPCNLRNIVADIKAFGETKEFKGNLPTMLAVDDVLEGVADSVDDVIKGGSGLTVSKLTAPEVKIAIKRNGMSADEFSKLLNPNRILTPNELKVVDKTRTDVGLPQAGTVMNKAIP